MSYRLLGGSPRVEEFENFTSNRLAKRLSVLRSYEKIGGRPASTKTNTEPGVVGSCAAAFLSVHAIYLQGRIKIESRIYPMARLYD